MERSIYSYDLPERIVYKLRRAGFHSDKDVKDSTTESIVSETELSDSDMVILKAALNPGPSQPLPPLIPLLDQLVLERKVRKMKTFSRNLDRLLDGGFTPARVSEVCGIPGTGKTQLCLQLCIAVQIPTAIGGSNGEALYIDNEGSFTLERLIEMSEAVVQRCQETAATSTNPDTLNEIQSFSVDKILSGVHYLHCLDHLELLAALHTLPTLISSNARIKLVVIDNVAVHFRELEDNKRINAQHQFFLQLSKLAASLNLVMVLTNQMTTRLRSDGGCNVVPALGQLWSHFACNRIIFKATEDGLRRTMTLAKSSYLPRSTLPFIITSAGITEPESDNPRARLYSVASPQTHIWNDDFNLGDDLDVPHQREKRFKHE